MDLKVLYVHPIDSGLQAYLKVNQKNCLITFQSASDFNTEFTVYSEDKTDEFLTDPKTRKELINQFLLFLNENREEIKLGIYFDNSKEMFDNFFQLLYIDKQNGLVNLSFNILEDRYIINGLKAIKTKEDVIFDLSGASFVHVNPNCLCENIKHNHEISDLKDCLILIEHQELILGWVKEKFLETFHTKKKSNVIQFPNNK